MNFEVEMKNKAKSAPKKLVLPEGAEPRIVKAAKILIDEKIAASVTLLGKIEDIQQTAKNLAAAYRSANPVCRCRKIPLRLPKKAV